jgi:hypothetical protein
VAAGAGALDELEPVEPPPEPPEFAPLEPPKRFAEELRGPDELETALAVLDEAIGTEELLPVEELPLELPALAPREDIRLPAILPRLPISRGAVIAAKRSAPIEPPTRSVRCRSPTETTAVRIAVDAVPPPPSLGESRSRLR